MNYSTCQTISMQHTGKKHWQKKSSVLSISDDDCLTEITAYYTDYIKSLCLKTRKSR